MKFRTLILIPAFALGLGWTMGIAQTSAADDPKAPADKPPPGWKVHTPADESYAVWVPEKTNRQSERSRTRTVNGVQVKVNTLVILINNGPTYVVEEGILSANLAKKLNRNDLENTFRDEAAKVIGGKVVEEKEVTVPGAAGKDVSGKEYRIEGKSIARIRIFVTPNRSRLFLVRIEGTKDQVDSEEAKVFLESAKLTPAKSPAATPRVVGATSTAFPEFKDAAPEGGLLVGLEVGLLKFGASTKVKSIRATYRVDDKEVQGTSIGKQGDEVVKVLAKPGYAVGEVTIRGDVWVEGFSLRFMKVVDGKLDIKDSYESDWVGGMDTMSKPVKLGGKGMPAIGLIGRADFTKDVAALGFLFKEPEKKEPEKK